MDTVDELIGKFLPSSQLDKVEKILYGSHPKKLDLFHGSTVREDVELKSFSLCESTVTSDEVLASSVRIGLCQMSLQTPTTATVKAQKASAVKAGLKILNFAAEVGVQIFCFQELWTMPMGICTGDKLPWVEFAEDALEGETTETLKKLAKEYNMVIISPILELDNDGEYWNTAVVIDANGKPLGTYRKTHIPINGNEMLFFRHSNRGIPVFKTKYGIVGVSLCFDRHHPANWYALSLQGAQIVFNPAASVESFSEHLWPIEGRAAAASNGFFVASINRAGTETFRNSKEVEKIRTFYGSSYVASPLGNRTPGLNSHSSGLLVVDVDLSHCTPFYNVINTKENVELLHQVQVLFSSKA